MKKENKKKFYAAACLLTAFILWTVIVRFVGVREIGPENSAVGLSFVNGFFHKLTGVNMTLYTVTDWLSIIPLGVVTGFAILGFVQLIRRKSLLKVDYSILVLGGFYAVTMAVYVFFEFVCINYRPVLIEGVLEASYPSSTTMLVMCVMPTAIMEINSRIKNTVLKRCVTSAISVFIAFMVIGRLVSGVHWLTDIIGGALFSAGLVLMYGFFCSVRPER